MFIQGKLGWFNIRSSIIELITLVKSREIYVIIQINVSLSVVHIRFTDLISIMANNPAIYLEQVLIDFFFFKCSLGILLYPMRSTDLEKCVRGI